MRHETFDFSGLVVRGATTTRPVWGASGKPPLFSFLVGAPDPSTFPIHDLVASSERVLRQDGGTGVLEYGGLYGFEGLRDLLAAKTSREDGRPIERDQVLLTTGGAQALTLACFAFVNPGDVVIAEAPSFGWFLRAIPAYGADLVTIPVDEQGMRVDELEKKLGELRKAGRRVKLIYTIPTCHNPTGSTMPIERRERLLSLAAAAGAAILEDDTYTDLLFEGERPRSLFSLDQAEAVIKVGTFSKILAPGLRVGWAIANASAITAMVSVRHDMGMSPLLTRLVADYAGSGRLETHIERLVSLYRQKCDATIAALGEHCGPLVRWRRPDGGFYVWAEMTEEVDPERLQQAAAQEGVAYGQGTSHFVGGMGRQFARLAFSAIPAGDIEPGIAAFGRALHKARR